MNPFAYLTVEQAVARVRERNDAIRVVLTPRLEEALAEARTRRSQPASSPLHGVPYVLKDVWETAGIRTTSGSYRHRNRISDKSGKLHRTLESLGAVLLGKSNLSDLALSPESANHLMGATCNPYDVSRTSGGSTGGAAAVADGMAAFDWGSDLGGSIRLPSAFCGVTGLRLSSTTWVPDEHVPQAPMTLRPMVGMGPIARTVAGCRTLLEALAPALRVGEPRLFDLRGLAIYSPADRFSRGNWPTFDADVRPLIARAGFSVRTAVGLPTPLGIEDTYNRLLASHFDEFLTIGELTFSEGVRAGLSALSIARLTKDKRLHPLTAQGLLALFLGRYSIYRNRERAIAKWKEVRSGAQRIWEEGWLLCAPSTTYPAPRHGRVLMTLGSMIFAKMGNLLDATCIAIPFGRFENGLPRSLQLLGPPGSEEAVLAAAEKIEKACSAQDGI